MMMEFVFSFLPSYFSIISLAKGKISKSVSLFLSHIGSKWYWPIRLQDFKSNISRTKWVENIGVGLVRNGCGHPGHKVNGWMNGWTELIFCMLMQIQERITLIIFGRLQSKMGMELWFQWMNESSWFFACIVLGLHYSCICYLLSWLLITGLPQSLSEQSVLLNLT